MKTADLVDHLNRISFFDDFTEKEKQALAQITGTVQNVARGECVIRKGTTDPTMYFVLEGTIVISAGEDLDHEITELHVGALFGDVPFVKAVPRVTSVLAKTDATLLRYHKDQMDQMDPLLIGKFKDQFLKLFVIRLDMLKSTISQNRVDFEKFFDSFQNIFKEIEVINQDTVVPEDDKQE
ncbi:hypothetical protein NITGR_870021 [Nitrospina gracilis 3/211]|uniref:Cyclic nucleotide-binding domain-containing protein n=1 Tax=Nitrospina gracilis (strain 3/211) TaxID=1266370 RepID=M1Z1H9_NITG3|nr:MULTISPECIES: cyclic nucleotide-binding domain-containing protein [Nitrospina]MCF8724670.1 CRP-like cAMP-binding protein [Nitrospina sp. Nb-3]CCQ91853.1 hypothetical protein NITGR_870021 [Nitrospina gracilis 3/211]